jgi:hypothetical protein
MPKYGKGLGVEFAHAVKLGLINEPFTTADIDKFARSRGWKPSPNYIAALLANGSAEKHSPTYKKYFTSVGNGAYILSNLAK